MDGHGTYVSLSRHRDGAQLHYGRDDFRDRSRLVRTLSRERAKDMASDYERRDPAQTFAERRGIGFREHVAEIAKAVPEKVRGIFDGLRLAVPGRTQDTDREAGPAASGPRRGMFDGLDLGRTAPAAERGIFANFRPPTQSHDPTQAAQAERERVRSLAVQRHARAVSAIWKMQDQGLPVLPHQQTELDRAREGLGATARHAVKDMEQAYSRNASLVQDASQGRIQRAIRAMQLEAEVRADPEKRADRFVERWQKLDKQYQAAHSRSDYEGIARTRGAMGAMAKSLERDAQMESVLRQQRDRLGIAFDTGRKLSHDLAGSVGIEMMDRSRGLSR
jgi:hypothetical protein